MRNSERTSWRVMWGLTLFGALCLSGTSGAETDAGTPAPGAEPVFRVLSPKQNELQIAAKSAKVVEMKTRIVRVDGFDTALINVTALTPTRLRVRGLKSGNTKMVLTDEDSATWVVDISVTRN